MKSYKINLNLNYVYEFLLNCNITQLLWPTYLIVRGYSLVDVGIAESIFHLTSMLCELPTGIVSDLYGRRFSRLMGRLLSILSIIVLMYETSRWMIYLSFIISALSYNLESGTDSAYVYDLMLENNDEKRFPKIQGYREMILQTACFIAIMIGGSLADKSYFLAYGVSFLITIVSIIVLLQMKEIKNTGYQKMNMFRGMLHQYQTSYALFKENHQILYLILSYSLFSASITTCHYYLTNYWKEMGMSISQISFFFTLENVAGLVAGLYAYKMIQRYSKEKIVLYLPLFVVVGLMGIPFFPISIISLIFIAFFESLLYVSITTFLNQIIPSSSRATLLSCMSMVFSIMMIIYFPIIGWIGDHYHLKTAFIILAGISAIVYIIYQYILRTRLLKKDLSE